MADDILTQNPGLGANPPFEGGPQPELPVNTLPEEKKTAEPPSALEDLFASESVRARLEGVIAWVQDNVLTIDMALQLGLIAGAIVLGFLVGPQLRRMVEKLGARRLPAGLLNRAAFALAALASPVAAYLVLQTAGMVLRATGRPTALLEAVASLLTAWIVIRLVTLVIRSRLWSRMAFYIAWPVAALDILGLLGPILAQLEAAALPIGENASISLLDVVRGVIAFAALLWAAGALRSFLEQRIYKLDELTPSLQTLIVQLLRILLPVIAFLIALQMVGVNLAALAIFGGAVGLGVGLGLQRSVSNLVNGFMLIMDKSIKPGDVISIHDTFGWVTSLGPRYVSIRTRDGTAHLIPNDQFIENGVENWSHQDKVIRLRLPIGVAYGEDPHEAIRLCVEAAGTVERVLQTPPPLCHLLGFGDSSVDLELRVWIDDPQNGITNVKGKVLLAVWDAFKANGIEIPFPQRDLHIKSAPGLEALPRPFPAPEAEPRLA